MTKKEAENKLLIGLVLALDNGLINEKMFEWVLKSVDRAKNNQKFFKKCKSK